MRVVSGGHCVVLQWVFRVVGFRGSATTTTLQTKFEASQCVEQPPSMREEVDWQRLDILSIPQEEKERRNAAAERQRGASDWAWAWAGLDRAGEITVKSWKSRGGIQALLRIELGWDGLGWYTSERTRNFTGRVSGSLAPCSQAPLTTSFLGGRLRS